MYYIVIASAFLLLVYAQTPPPDPGLFCCPSMGPAGFPIKRQGVVSSCMNCESVSRLAILTSSLKLISTVQYLRSYGPKAGPNERCSFQSANTGIGPGGPAPDCPVVAVPNPHPPTCPV
ncbi:hypothetical protein FPV67DRAFT_1452750 [Lyophyllum atratum]|nr:hypothetical protein FPV67DRAFT_1452750 [Lyophyllum atratum]